MEMSPTFTRTSGRHSLLVKCKVLLVEYRAFFVESRVVSKAAFLFFAVCCGVLRCFAVCCVCCSVLQCEISLPSYSSLFLMGFVALYRVCSTGWR